MTRSISPVLKLQRLIDEFCSTELDWEIPSQSESEPTYTGRVLVPKFEAFVRRVSEPNLTFRADKSSYGRPKPIFFDNQPMYPDISFEYLGIRSVAIEVKYLEDQGFSGSMATAIGQGLAYAAWGYEYSHVLMISKTGGFVVPKIEVNVLNENLKNSGVKFHIIC